MSPSKLCCFELGRSLRRPRQNQQSTRMLSTATIIQKSSTRLYVRSLFAKVSPQSPAGPGFEHGCSGNRTRDGGDALGHGNSHSAEKRGRRQTAPEVRARVLFTAKCRE